MDSLLQLLHYMNNISVQYVYTAAKYYSCLHFKIIFDIPIDFISVI